MKALTFYRFTDSHYGSMDVTDWHTTLECAEQSSIDLNMLKSATIQTTTIPYTKENFLALLNGAELIL